MKRFFLTTLSALTCLSSIHQPLVSNPQAAIIEQQLDNGIRYVTPPIKRGNDFSFTLFIPYPKEIQETARKVCSKMHEIILESGTLSYSSYSMKELLTPGVFSNGFFHTGWVTGVIGIAGCIASVTFYPALPIAMPAIATAMGFFTGAVTRYHTGDFEPSRVIYYRNYYKNTPFSEIYHKNYFTPYELRQSFLEEILNKCQIDLFHNTYNSNNSIYKQILTEDELHQLNDLSAQYKNRINYYKTQKVGKDAKLQFQLKPIQLNRQEKLIKIQAIFENHYAVHELEKYNKLKEDQLKANKKDYKKSTSDLLDLLIEKTIDEDEYKKQTDSAKIQYDNWRETISNEYEQKTRSLKKQVIQLNEQLVIDNQKIENEYSEKKDLIEKRIGYDKFISGYQQTMNALSAEYSEKLRKYATVLHETRGQIENYRFSPEIANRIEIEQELMKKNRFL